MNVKLAAALILATLLSACGGGMQVGGGPSSDSMTGMMLDTSADDNSAPQDTAGTEIPE